MAEDIKTLKLNNAKVLFFNPVDEGYGTSITVDATDPAVKKQITDWYEANKIGKDNPGVPKFKEYTNDKTGETTEQFAFKITDRTQYAGANGLTKDDIGQGAIVHLIARAFTYNNKYTGGKDKVGQSVSAVVVISGKRGGAEQDLAELLGEVGEDPEPGITESSIPF